MIMFTQNLSKCLNFTFYCTLLLSFSNCHSVMDPNTPFRVDIQPNIAKINWTDTLPMRAFIYNQDKEFVKKPLIWSIRNRETPLSDANANDANQFPPSQPLARLHKTTLYPTGASGDLWVIAKLKDHPIGDSILVQISDPEIMDSTNVLEPPTWPFSDDTYSYEQKAEMEEPVTDKVLPDTQSQDTPNLDTLTADSKPADTLTSNNPPVNSPPPKANKHSAFEILQPKGGETYHTGQLIHITWREPQDLPIEASVLQISIDRGANWHTMLNEKSRNKVDSLIEIEWQIPDSIIEVSNSGLKLISIVSDQCIIRIQSMQNINQPTQSEIFSIIEIPEQAHALTHEYGGALKIPNGASIHFPPKSIPAHFKKGIQFNHLPLDSLKKECPSACKLPEIPNYSMKQVYSINQELDVMIFPEAFEVALPLPKSASNYQVFYKLNFSDLYWKPIKANHVLIYQGHLRFAHNTSGLFGLFENRTPTSSKREFDLEPYLPQYQNLNKQKIKAHFQQNGALYGPLGKQVAKE